MKFYRKAFLSFLSFFLIITLSASLVAGGPLRNQGFESGLAYWSYDHAYSSDQTRSGGGDYSAAIGEDLGCQSGGSICIITYGPAYIQQSFGISGGTYGTVFSFYYDSLNSDVKVTIYHNQGTTVLTFDNTGFGEGWEQGAYTLSPSITSISKVKIERVNTAQQLTFIDDVTFAPLNFY